MNTSTKRNRLNRCRGQTCCQGGGGGGEGRIGSLGLAGANYMMDKQQGPAV